MIFNCPKELLDTKESSIYIEEDAIELFVKTIEVTDEFVYFKGYAIIDNEKYNDFTIEVTLVEIPEEKNFQSLLDAEWDFYDLVY